MKNVLLATAALLLLLMAPVAQTADQAQSTADKDVLLKLEREWNDAYTKHDKDTVARILADDWSFIDADSNVVNKRQYLDTSSRVQIKSENLTDMAVRLFVDSAVVTSVWSGTYTFDGKATTETIRYTDFFVKRKGQWLAVATQGTRIPKH